MGIFGKKSSQPAAFYEELRKVLEKTHHIVQVEVQDLTIAHKYLQNNYPKEASRIYEKMIHVFKQLAEIEASEEGKEREARRKDFWDMQERQIELLKSLIRVIVLLSEEKNPKRQEPYENIARDLLQKLDTEILSEHKRVRSAA